MFYDISDVSDVMFYDISDVKMTKNDQNQSQKC